ncbi:hypothetical protein N9S07_02360 [Nitrosomonadales bacterium]|jgi:hypothetical protein|nr:hypothetical protein [Nitrosomonadales bacterium]
MQSNVLTINELNEADVENIYTSALFLNQVTSPNYSRLSQQYYVEYYDQSWTDLSVALEYKGEIKALFILYADNNRSASFFTQPALIVTPENASVELLAEIEGMFALVFNRLKKLNIAKITVNNTHYIDAFVKLIESVEVKAAYVDLSLSLEEIKRNARKSYKSLINWGLKNFEIKVINQESQDRQSFNQFMHFHREVAGRSTRSDESWDIQYQMVCKGEAFVLQGFYNGRLVSASLITHSVSEAWYGVGVYDRALMAERLPLAHGLLFKAFDISKEKGIKTFIIGNISTLSTEKEESIAKFKTGFTKSFVTTKHIDAYLK